MNYLFYASALFVAFLLQAKISVLSVSPNLTALFVYFIGIRHGQTMGLFSGLLTGAVEDIITSPLFGPNMLGKGLIGMLSSFFVSGGIFIWTPLLGIMAVALLTCADNLVVFLLLGIFDKPPAGLYSMIFMTVMQALLNSAAGIFIKPAHAD